MKRPHGTIILKSGYMYSETIELLQLLLTCWQVTADKWGNGHGGQRQEMSKKLLTVFFLPHKGIRSIHIAEEKKQTWKKWFQCSFTKTPLLHLFMPFSVTSHPPSYRHSQNEGFLHLNQNMTEGIRPKLTERKLVNAMQVYGPPQQRPGRMPDGETYLDNGGSIVWEERHAWFLADTQRGGSHIIQVLWRGTCTCWTQPIRMRVVCSVCWTSNPLFKATNTLCLCKASCSSAGLTIGALDLPTMSRGSWTSLSFPKPVWRKDTNIKMNRADFCSDYRALTVISFTSENFFVHVLAK